MTYSAAGRLALAQRIDSMSRPAFAPPPARTIPMTLDSGPRSSWPVELQAPAIERHRAGNTGVPFFWSFEAAAAGPHLMATRTEERRVGTEGVHSCTYRWSPDHSNKKKPPLTTS